MKDEDTGGAELEDAEESSNAPTRATARRGGEGVTASQGGEGTLPITGGEREMERDTESLFSRLLSLPWRVASCCSDNDDNKCMMSTSSGNRSSYETNTINIFQ
jgi:hypothetical protein